MKRANRPRTRGGHPLTEESTSIDRQSAPRARGSQPRSHYGHRSGLLESHQPWSCCRKVNRCPTYQTH